MHIVPVAFPRTLVDLKEEGSEREGGKEWARPRTSLSGRRHYLAAKKNKNKTNKERQRQGDRERNRSVTDPERLPSVIKPSVYRHGGGELSRRKGVYSGPLRMSIWRWLYHSRRKLGCYCWPGIVPRACPADIPLRAKHGRFKQGHKSQAHQVMDQRKWNNNQGHTVNWATDSRPWNSDFYLRK